LGDPVYFFTHDGLGVWLPDALHARMKPLQDPGSDVLQGRGPSVSIRLEVRSSSLALRCFHRLTLLRYSVARVCSMEPTDPNKGFQESTSPHNSD
jgi:hypothetical protein